VETPKEDMMKSQCAAWTSLVTILALLIMSETSSAENGATVTDGAKVSLEYTLTLPDKTVADSNVGQAPITFIQGAHEIVPGLEKALEGMKAGQKKRVEVAAVDAYGPYNNKLRQTVEKDKLPKDIKAGDILQASDGRLVKVLEIAEKNVVLDLNHPLAGKALTFDVNILNVEQAEASSEGKKP
jgi:FKBP-type peptidyl-prolyl cis-trans isomerase SlyD